MYIQFLCWLKHNNINLKMVLSHKLFNLYDWINTLGDPLKLNLSTWLIGHPDSWPCVSALSPPVVCVVLRCYQRGCLACLCIRSLSCYHPGCHFLSFLVGTGPCLVDCIKKKSLLSQCQYLWRLRAASELATANAWAFCVPRVCNRVCPVGGKPQISLKWLSNDACRMSFVLFLFLLCGIWCNAFL